MTQAFVIPSTLVDRARKFAVTAHGNQKYGDEFPYLLHLTLVEGVLLRFGITDPAMRCGANLHDVLEDTPTKPETLRTLFGDRITDMVERVTEPKGGNRKWRHEQTYPRIATSQDAVALKLADRIANVEAGGRLTSMYAKEHAEFKRVLQRRPDYIMYTPLLIDEAIIEAMWSYLDDLFVELLAKIDRDLGWTGEPVKKTMDAPGLNVDVVGLVADAQRRKG